MKLSCQLREITGNNPENLPQGKYLYINKNDSLISIPFSEFQSYYEESKRDMDSYLPEPSFQSEEQAVVPEKSSGSDFKKIINYLIEKIAITESDFNSTNNELIIESGFGNFLELPWENVAKNKVIVFRRVPGETKNENKKTLNNLLFVTSNSVLSNEGEAADLKDMLKDEISAIIQHAILAIPKDFKIDDMHISKHTTKHSFKALQWESYNYVHFIMHGHDNGGLCLEEKDLDRYKSQDVMNIDEVISALDGKNFTLLFFSFCNSSGPRNGDSSLAFNITNKGISKHAIGYRFGVGQNSAFAFAEIFYKILFNGFGKDKQNIIEEVYKKSLLEYYTEPTTNKDYVPMLYVNF